jgi:hypothetical protein
VTTITTTATASVTVTTIPAWLPNPSYTPNGTAPAWIPNPSYIGTTAGSPARATSGIGSSTTPPQANANTQGVVMTVAPSAAPTSTVQSPAGAVPTPVPGSHAHTIRIRLLGYVLAVGQLATVIAA